MSVELPAYEHGKIVAAIGIEGILLLVRASDLLVRREAELTPRELFDAAEEIRPGGLTLEQIELVWREFLDYVAQTEPELFTDGETKH